MYSTPSKGSSKRTFLNEWIYSVEDCGFVKPLSHTKTSLVYILQPGNKYLKFSLGRYRGSQYIFDIYSVTVDEDGDVFEKHLLSAVIPPDLYEDILSDENAPELLREFMSAIPEGEPAIPPSYRYRCKGVNTIIGEIKDYLEEFKVLSS